MNQCSQEKTHCKAHEDMILFFSRETIEPRRLYPPDERKEGTPIHGRPMNVTYADLFQFCIFVVALISLCYAIFRDKK